MSNDWVGLDDDMGASQQSAGGGVQYVGVVETPDEPMPEVRTPRRPVQRVSPSARPMQSNGVVARSGAVRGSRQQEPLVYFPTESGAQVALNQEAAMSMAKSKLHTVGGKQALRIQPGQYLVVVPGSRFPDEPPRRARRRPADESESAGGARVAGGPGMGTDWAAFAQGMVGSLATLGTGIATAVTGERESQRQAELDRLRIQTEAEAGAAARQTAAEEAARLHQENMARLRQQQAELNAVQAGGATSTAATVVSGGTSPIVWVVVAVAAIGGIGGLVWFLSSRGKSEK